MSQTGGGVNLTIGNTFDGDKIEQGDHLGVRLKSVPEELKQAVINRLLED